MTDAYGLKDVERRLAEDDRTAELGVQLVEHAGRLFVRGRVASAQARDNVLEVVREQCPGTELVDELTCAEPGLANGPRQPEEIR